MKWINRKQNNIFERDKGDYYKPVRTDNFWSRNYIEYESNGDTNKALSIENYLNKIRPLLKDIINDLKKSFMWKIQLTIAVNFIFSKDTDEKHVMHSMSDNIKIMNNDKADEFIEELFQSFFSRYQIWLEKLMKGSEHVFDCVNLLYYRCYKIIPNCGEPYIDSPEWIKNKKATINLINKKDNECFQYVIAVALNHEKT